MKKFKESIESYKINKNLILDIKKKNFVEYRKNNLSKDQQIIKFNKTKYKINLN